MKQIIAKMRKIVIPKKELQISKKQIAYLASHLVNTQVKNFPEITSLELGGSFAKGTWLMDEADIDIFIKFKKTTSKEKFTEISKKVGLKSMENYNPYLRYSEHPYVEAKIKKTKINIVPCYEVNLGEWKSSADRSPFHTKYMKEHLSLKMKNEIRLLKTFLKSGKIYGSEIAKQGFSGYVSEVLIINFGTFENVIESISQIQPNQVIGKTSQKFETPIPIIDPIDSNRNLAAAISNENLGKFVVLCRAFKKNPSKEFFKEKRGKLAKYHWDNLLVIKLDIQQRSPDIIWGQIKRTTSSLATQIELGGFRVLRSKSFSDEKNVAYLFFLLESTTIPKNYLKHGPDFFRKEDFSHFILKNIQKTELMWVNNDKKIVSIEKRKHYQIEEFVKHLLKNNMQSGIPQGLHSDFRRGVKVFVGKKNLGKSIKEVASELISTDETFFCFN